MKLALPLDVEGVENLDDHLLRAWDFDDHLLRAWESLGVEGFDPCPETDGANYFDALKASSPDDIYSICREIIAERE